MTGHADRYRRPNSAMDTRFWLEGGGSTKGPQASRPALATTPPYCNYLHTINGHRRFAAATAAYRVTLGAKPFVGQQAGPHQPWVKQSLP